MDAFQAAMAPKGKGTETGDAFSARMMQVQPAPVAPPAPVQQVPFGAVPDNAGIQGADVMQPADFRTIDNVVRGLARGATFGIADKAAALGNSLIGPGNYDENLASERERNKLFEAESPVLYHGSELAGGLATGIPGAGRVMAMNAPKLAKLGALGATGGALAGFGETDGSPLEQLEGAGKGALAGAVMGPAVGYGGQLVGMGAQKLGNALSGGGVNPEVAKLAQRAGDFGINVRGGQISESPAVKFLDSALNRLPLTGYAGKSADQRQAFTQAVAKTFGEDAPAITQDVMSRAKTRIGKMFDDVAANTTIQADDAFRTKLNAITADAAQVLPASELAPLDRQVGNILSKIANDTIDGKSYQALVAKGSPLDRAMGSADSNIRYYAGQIRGRLDDALQASATPELQATLKTARQQYKNMKTIEDLAEKADAGGQISPALLLNQVRKSYDNYAYSGAGELGELAKIGQQFLKEPPSSGTAERLASLGTLGVGGYSITNPTAALGAAAATGGALLAARGLGMALDSPAYRNRLISSGLSPSPILTPELRNQLMGLAALEGGRAGLPVSSGQ